MLKRNTFNTNPDAEIIIYIPQGEYFIDSSLNFNDIKPGDNINQVIFLAPKE